MKPENLPTQQALEALLNEFKKRVTKEKTQDKMQENKDEEVKENNSQEQAPVPMNDDDDVDFTKLLNDFLNDYINESNLSEEGEANANSEVDNNHHNTTEGEETISGQSDAGQSDAGQSDAGQQDEEATENNGTDIDETDEEVAEDDENNEEVTDKENITQEGKDDDKEESDQDKEDRLQNLYLAFLEKELLESDDEDDDGSLFDDDEDNDEDSEEDEETDSPEDSDSGDPLEELMALTGLEDVKKAIKQQLDFTRIMKIRKDAGKKVPQRLMHLLLTGNPGTGKTTVAKLIGRIYKKEGILNKGHVVEANRATLVGEYIGQTEKKVQEAIEEAEGGILFIDEIYALAEHNEQHSETKDYGFKVIDTLMPVLDKVDSDLMVIGAGYPNKVRNFLQTNPGLTSRFPTVLNFQDFTVEELMEIGMNILKKYDFTPTEEFVTAMEALLKKAIKIKDHGNARMVNTLINNFVIPNLCTRLASTQEQISDVEKTSLVLKKDLPTLEQLFPLAEKKERMGYA